MVGETPQYTFDKAEEDTILKPRIAIVALALPLLYGIIPLLFAYIILREWAAERTALIICGVLFLVSGATMLLSAIGLFVSMGGWRKPLWAGGAASLLAAAVMIGATLTDVLPCSGPD